jgi:hypothetical protein
MRASSDLLTAGCGGDPQTKFAAPALSTSASSSWTGDRGHVIPNWLRKEFGIEKDHARICLQASHALELDCH